MSRLRFAAILGSLVAAWTIAAWLLLRPESLIDDWNGWRQADTQTIALNLARPGGSLLYPQIAWGGDGAGYVEAEFQLYPALFAPALRRLGPVEWPGQATSLALYASSALLLGVLLRRSYGEMAGLLGVGAFLSTRCALHLATAVQPEALGVFLYVVSWCCFLRFEGSPRTGWIVGFAVAGALAMVVRPNAAQLGITSFLVLALRSPGLLRSRRVWLAWTFMVAALAGYLWFARGIYAAHGNTFGILSGGDSKLPNLDQILRPGRGLDAMRVLVLWGIGPVGALCLVALALRRQVHAPVIGLAVGGLAWMIVSFRYSSHEAYGSHYPVLAGVLGAWCVSRLAGRWRGPRRAVLMAALGAALVAQYALSLRHRRANLQPDKSAACIAELARAVKGRLAPGELVVTRGPFSYDEDWKTINNFEDPRFFYATGTRGWVLGADEDDPAALAGFVARGARVFAEPDIRYHTPRIAAWLAERAQPMVRTRCGGAWSLSPRLRSAASAGQPRSDSGMRPTRRPVRMLPRAVHWRTWLNSDWMVLPSKPATQEGR